MQVENVENDDADNGELNGKSDEWLDISESRQRNSDSSVQSNSTKTSNRNYGTRQKPESINLGSSIPRKRGRPRGSTNTRKSTTDIQGWYIDGLGLGLILASGYLIAKPFNNPKYMMTTAEAKNAAVAIMTVSVRYKQVRDLMAVVNLDSDVGIIIKGFIPYIMRAFLKEVIEDVVSGFFVSKPAGRERPTRTNDGTHVQQNGQHSENNGQPPIPEVNVSSDWRAL